MLIKTYKYFNQITRQALFDQVEGYVDKSKSVSREIASLRDRYKLEKVYRFDLGENVDGFSPRVSDFLNNTCHYNNICESLNEYPDITHKSLRLKIADFYGIQRENIVISAGLDSILDIITRIFFDYNDSYLMPVPDFFLFENYSERMGARPIFLELNEESNFEWTEDVFNNFCDLVIRFKPKIVWISNPCNPTGKPINDSILKEIIKITNNNNVFCVVDEAYGEYIRNNASSAVKYLNKFKNLMVLRTFSKAYGLAGLRIGYLMSSSKDIIKAMLMHRQYFPASQLALNIAEIALNDQNFINQTIILNKERKKSLFNQLQNLDTFDVIPSSTNIFMLKNTYLSSIKLNLLLKKRGIITSVANLLDEDNNKYLRLTVKKAKENDYLIKICTEIEKELIQVSGNTNYSYILS